jgi:hypothetical protein
MKSSFLFPNRTRIIGYILIIISCIIITFNYYTLGAIMNSTDLSNLDPIPTSIWIEIVKNDITYITMIAGLIIVGFSKEQIEDEQIAQLRLDSLQWAFYINYTIIILAVIFTFGSFFLAIVLYNILTLIICFIIRFRWKIYQQNRLLIKAEKVS